MDGPLAEAEQALERGDFGRARKLARARLKDSDESVQRAARAILSRSAADPVIVWLAGACTLFFVAVLYFTLWHK
jgi:hypothetical protein